VLQVVRGHVAVAPHRGEHLVTRGVPVRGGHPRVDGVRVGRCAGAALARGGDQVGDRGVVVPAAEVHADLVGPPAGQPRGPVQVHLGGPLEEGIPRAQHHRRDPLAAGVGHALVSVHVPADTRLPQGQPCEPGHGPGIRVHRAATSLSMRSPERVTFRVKKQWGAADRCCVRQEAMRRAGDVRVGAVRRLGRALLAGLIRPLAEDEDRVAFWVRHVRHGIVLTEVAALAVLVYTLFASTPGYRSPITLGIAPLVIFGTPALLFLPLADMMRDRRGPLMFYGWSIAVTAVVIVIVRVDGGATSPLFALLFLTLGFMAITYPPQGVVLTGAVMTGGYLFGVAWPHVTSSALFITVVMGSFTLICALVSANSWAAYDRQALLIRTQETLASTDPLTGVPNRRAFLDRLSAAVAAAGTGRRTVVCLVDLDGFKGVNDRDGHAAGDAVLKAVTAALGGVVRETDTVARLGGDEFAVLADVADVSHGEILAERLRAAVAAAGRTAGVTGSVGAAEVRPEDDVEELLHRADSAMYRAKTAGGNRVTALAP
jgi:diguanylate cyclase (GGDEF)-like protein